MLESNAVHVNVIGDFTEEGILRSIDVDFTTAPTSTSNLPTGSSVPTGQTGTTAPSTTLVKKVAPGLVPSGTSTIRTIKARITLARLIRPLHGRHYVTVKVASHSSTARIRLQMTVQVRVLRHGRFRIVTRKVTKTVTVRTGRTVRITVPRTVIAVKATLLR